MKQCKKLKFNKSKSKLLLLSFILSMCFCTNIQAQQITVKGTITSIDSNEPIPGVSILVKGSRNGVSTDFDGNYSIKATIGDILSFSYLGMEDKAVKVTGSVINVSLNSSSETLDEIIVIGYGAIKKKEVTGAVSVIKAADIEQIVTSDLGTALQGQMAGVNVIASSGQPGASSQILIRGITTIAGSNTPLYIVDGLIQDGDPNISPNEVESIIT